MAARRESREDDHFSLGSNMLRSTSAPPNIAVSSTDEGETAPGSLVVNGEVINADDPRLTPEYYTYYYAQRPLDPRLPPPLLNWSSWRYAQSRGAGKGVSGLDKDTISKLASRPQSSQMLAFLSQFQNNPMPSSSSSHHPSSLHKTPSSKSPSSATSSSKPAARSSARGGLSLDALEAQANAAAEEVDGLMGGGSRSHSSRLSVADQRDMEYHEEDLPLRRNTRTPPIGPPNRSHNSSPAPPKPTTTSTSLSSPTNKNAGNTISPAKSFNSHAHLHPPHHISASAAHAAASLKGGQEAQPGFPEHDPVSGSSSSASGGLSSPSSGGSSSSHHRHAMTEEPMSAPGETGEGQPGMTTSSLQSRRARRSDPSQAQPSHARDSRDSRDSETGADERDEDEQPEDMDDMQGKFQQLRFAPGGPAGYKPDMGINPYTGMPYNMEGQVFDPHNMPHPANMYGMYNPQLSPMYPPPSFRGSGGGGGGANGVSPMMAVMGYGHAPQHQHQHHHHQAHHHGRHSVPNPHMGMMGYQHPSMNGGGGSGSASANGANGTPASPPSSSGGAASPTSPPSASGSHSGAHNGNATPPAGGLGGINQASPMLFKGAAGAGMGGGPEDGYGGGGRRATVPSYWDQSGGGGGGGGGGGRGFKGRDGGGRGGDRSERGGRGGGPHGMGGRGREGSVKGERQPKRGSSSSTADGQAWLDEFKMNKASTNHVSLQEVVARGQLLELATDQYGSRFIQQKLEVATEAEKEAAFEHILGDTLKLCTDVFGNYVIQKFLEHGTVEQRKALVSKLLGNVLVLSLQMYGCRVVQKALDVFEKDADAQAQIVKELHGQVIPCVTDQNGNHVIQKCIEKVPGPLIEFIVSAFHHQVFSLSSHPYGCRVIQRLLEHCSEAQRDAILEEILGHTEELCQNQYGNYVVQHVLVHGTAWHRGAIITALRGKVCTLSRHKFASNVVEKCFAHAGKPERAELIHEVLGSKDPEGTPSPLVNMVKDQYGNYVIQKMIDVCDEEHRAAIVAHIKRHLPALRKIPYGKHIISRVEKITGSQF